MITLAPERTRAGSPSIVSRAVAQLSPNWFVCVMGTGIVANTALVLPFHNALHGFAVAIWLLASGLLVALIIGFVWHWVGFRINACGFAQHPVMGHFYGAIPMALLTVGIGTAIMGPQFIGHYAATVISGALWALGAITGVCTAVAVPFSMMSRTRDDHDLPLPAWLMPVVPPVVAATAGAVLVPHTPIEFHRPIVMICVALFGMTVILGFLTIAAVYSRLMSQGFPNVDVVPSIWIILGVIGQSVTAINLLAPQMPSVVPAISAPVISGVAIVYGLCVGGFGLAMFFLAAALTINAARQKMSFTFAWWSFTFPIGTCVTGSAALARAMNSPTLEWISVGLFALLTVAWLTVTINTTRWLTRLALD